MKKTLLFLAFLPSAAFCQFEEIAQEICTEDKKAFVIFGADPLNATILKQPETRGVQVYELRLDSEFAKRRKLQTPTMCLYNKNMMEIACTEVSRSGWRRMKPNFAKKTSADCLLLEAAPEKLEERPSEEELSHFPIKVPTPDPAAPKQEKKPAASAAAGGDEAARERELNAVGLEYATFYRVQIGAYANEENAKEKVRQYAELNPSYKLEDGLYKVTFGTFTKEESAREMAAKHNGIIKRIR